MALSSFARFLSTSVQHRILPYSKKNSPFPFLDADFRFPRFMSAQRIPGYKSMQFEDCDYKHWVILFDYRFFKDARISPEKMMKKIYVLTAAKVLGSEQEATRNIYQYGTYSSEDFKKDYIAYNQTTYDYTYNLTTYFGFRVKCSLEKSEYFRDCPGVSFILPDNVACVNMLSRKDSLEPKMSEAESEKLGKIDSSDPWAQQLYAHGVSMETNVVEAKLDEGNIHKAESALCEGLSLNFEVAGKLLVGGVEEEDGYRE